MAGTSLEAAWTTSSEKVLASKRPWTREPKTALMAATDGSGTLKQQNCRLRRLGMSFLPPPGVFIAAMYWQSVMNFMSPMGFSSWYIPPCSSSCRTISLVTWSPQSLYAGMEMSSMKTIIFFPPGGPKVRPWRFSTDPSTENWKMLGVVRDEKVMALLVISSGLSALVNCITTVVLAVPGPPTRSVALPTDDTICSSRSYRTESSVGMTSDAYLGVSLLCGYAHVGTRVLQCSQFCVCSPTRYSKMVSPLSASAAGRFVQMERSFLSNLGRSPIGRRPPQAQVMQ